jgi:hypothetical protein
MAELWGDYTRDYNAQGVNHGWTLIESTTDTLGAGGIFFSLTDILLHNCYSHIRGTIFSDVDGTLRLLYIGNIDTGPGDFDAEQTISYTGGTFPGVNLPILAPTLAVEYENGAAAQSEFRLFLYALNGISG